MNKYELLQEENQNFWESLENNHEKLNAQDFTVLAEEELAELALDALAV